MQTRTQATHEQPSKMRLICLAADRQQLAQYRLWAQALGDPIELVAVYLPAKGTTADIDLTTPSTALITTLTEHLRPYLTQPHALFAQEQGAAVALVLTALVQQIYPGQTRHLFVANCDSPEPGTNLHVPAMQVPTTVLYAPGSLSSTLGWQRLASRGLELIELPPSTLDSALFNQRMLRIFNTHLGLLSY